MKNLFRKALPLLFSGGVFLFSSAQPSFQVFNSGNSFLPYNTVRWVTCNRSTNDLWVATDLGVAKVSSAGWTIYTSSNSPLPENDVRVIFIDRSGNTWLGTQGSGLVKFDGLSWSVYNMGNSGIPDNQVKAISQDTAGNMWVGTPSGLSKFDGNTWMVWDFSNSNLISTHITSIAIGSDNIKRIGTLNGGMAYFNDTTFTIYSYWTGNFPENTVTSIAVDNQNRPWACLNSTGIIVHMGGPAWNWMNTGNSGIPSDVLTHVYIDATQKKYIGSQNKGIIIYDGNSFVNYDPGNSSFPDTWASASVTDTSGILWVGTFNNGLVKINFNPSGIVSSGISKHFTVFPNPALGKISIQANEKIERIEISDLSGKLQLEKRPLSTLTSFDLEGISGGSYFIRVYFSGGESAVRRLIVTGSGH